METTYLWTDEWIKKLWYIHTVEYYSALKKRGNPDICKNIDKTGGHQAKENTPEVGEWGKQGEVGKSVPAFSYKTNKV